ncbi:MAG: mechanosensitive ion channel family protein [Gemmatimonadota bacterium]
MRVPQTPPVDPGFVLIPGVTAETQTNLILSVVIIFLAFLARRGVLALVNRRVEDSALRYRWAKTSATVAFVVTSLILAQVWFTAIRSIGTFLGLLSAGLAIALKDLVADLAGWAFIMWRRPFDLGDRVAIGGFAGDVVDKSLFQFTVMEIGNWVDADQSTGRLIHIPNARVFTEPLANYVAGFPYLWNEIPVLITLESDWRRGKELLEALAEDMTIDITREAHKPRREGEERFLIRYRKLTPVVYVSVQDSGVLLTLRYLCRPRERRGSASQLWERLLEALADEPSVVLAYPTQRVNLSREVLAEPPGDVGSA